MGLAVWQLGVIGRPDDPPVGGWVVALAAKTDDIDTKVSHYWQ